MMYGMGEAYRVVVSPPQRIFYEDNFCSMSFQPEAKLLNELLPPLLLRLISWRPMQKTVSFLAGSSREVTKPWGVTGSKDRVFGLLPKPCLS
jgi:hypothetical protein